MQTVTAQQLPADLTRATLKRCPFCGEPPTWIHHTNDLQGNKIYSLGCCGFRRVGYDLELVTAWERRA